MPPRSLQKNLKWLLWKGFQVYLDDIIGIHISFDDHIKRLGSVPEDAWSKTALKKYCYFKKEVWYLEHIVSEKGTVDDQKIPTIYNLSIPKFKNELKSFLGLSI